MVWESPQAFSLNYPQKSGKGVYIGKSVEGIISLYKSPNVYEFVYEPMLVIL